ncbi:hypothetical protein Tco_1158650 [Tanacetum coccineum]
MSTRSSARRLLSPIEDPERLLSRRNRSEPSLLFDLEEDDMAGQALPQGTIPDLLSMEELLQAPTDGVGDAIVVTLILANQFELKISLLNLVTAIAFHRTSLLTPEKSSRRDLHKFESRKLSALKGFEEFGALHDGIALQNLDQVVREYAMEILSSFTFRDHIEELDEADTMVFQFGGEKRRANPPTTTPPNMHSGNEKVTLDELFLLHSMGRGVSVYVPWHVAKFFSDKAKRYNGLGIGEMVAEIPEVTGEDDVGTGQTEIGGVGRHPNMSNANRLRAMDERLGEIWRTEQERFISWNTDHLSQLLAHHHIDHTYYDGTHYSYVSNIPDLGVQQGVNFMFGTPGYSTAPSPSASQFGMFGDAYPSTSRNQDDMNED